MFQHNHVNQDKVMDEFADAVCDILGKGVLHRMSNGSTNAPPPPAAKKQKIPAVETGASEE
jgi:hypothetical protein